MLKKKLIPNFYKVVYTGFIFNAHYVFLYNQFVFF